MPETNPRDRADPGMTVSARRREMANAGRKQPRQLSDDPCRATEPGRGVDRDSSEATTGGEPTLFLYPARIAVFDQPTPVMTILGSCVAVCLYDPIARAGGVAHYLLPSGPECGGNPWRFGNLAIPELVQRLLDSAGKRERMHAKVFGGASVLLAAAQDDTRLGDSNVDVARDLLSSLEIPVVAEDVGGGRGRKLIFHTDNGDAWVKLI
jgi:chemotaxis protein CheD